MMKHWTKYSCALLCVGALQLGLQAGDTAGALTFELTPESAGVERFGTVQVASENGTPVWNFTRVGDYLRVNASGKINPAQGTIAFHARELDATPEQRVWNPYFQWQGEGAVFQLLRLWQPLELGGGLWRHGNRSSWVGAPIPQQGEWHHWALTYQKNRLCLFRDGEEVKTTVNADFIFPSPAAFFTIGRVPEASRNADGFHTGNHLWNDAPAQAEKMQIGKESYGAYALKEFCAFNRPLTAAEVRYLAQNGPAKLNAAPADDEMQLDFAASTTLERLRVLLASPRLEPGDTLTVQLFDTDGQLLLEQPVPQGTGGSEYVYLSTATLPVGDYRLTGIRRDSAGNELRAPEVEWSKEVPPEWLGNDLGQADVVLPGFEALHADASTVRIWGREYHFGNSLMPQQIVNQGVPMLAAPMDWFLRSQSGDATLQFDRVQLESASDTRAIYTGTGRLGAFAVTGKTTIEYDGFMDFELTFTPPADGFEVTGLKMEIPLVPEEADLLFFESARQAEWPEAWRSAVTPIGTKGVITLGNADRCIQWLLESDQYYFPEDNPQTLQTRTTPTSRNFTVEVIGAPRRITEAFTLRWMLQAGPVKARPSHWRGWTRAGRRYIDPELHNLVNYQYDWWARSPGEPIPAEGFPSTPDPAFMAGAIPCVSMHFGGFRETREKDNPQRRTPEWQRFETEWQRLPLRLTDDSFPGWNEQTLDTKAASWGDWHIWSANELFRTTGVRGLYYDDWLPGSSTNEFAGSGYPGIDGTRRATRDIRNQREFHRRIYALVKQYRPDDGVIYLHVSGCPLLPVISFADINYDGEVMVWSDRIPPEGRYFDSYRMDIFRQLFSGRQLGLVPGFHDVTTKTLSCGGSPQILLKENQRQLWALLLLHDIHLQSAFTSGLEELRFLWLDAFGIAEEDVEFTGYWAKDAGARLRGFSFPAGDPDRASAGYLSIYTRPGKALLIVVRDAPNNYAGSVTAEIELDRARLGLPSGPLQALDMESMGRTPLGEVDGDILRVPVNCDDFAAVLIEAR